MAYGGFSMNLMIAIVMTTFLLSFVMFIQALEFFILIRNGSLFSVWSFKNLSSDLKKSLPLSEKWIEFFFSDKSFKIIITIQMLAALATAVFSLPICLIILFITHLLICIRFRGTFNGGSDMMTFVVLTGALVANLSTSVDVQKFGLVYIAVHAIYSYFKAGLVKIKNKDWRSGQVLPIFLKQSLFLDIRKLATVLETSPKLAKLLCWFVIVFELMSLCLPFLSFAFVFYFLTAVLFHFLIYVSFGLNRFFWVWMASWPSIFFLMTLI